MSGKYVSIIGKLPDAFCCLVESWELGWAYSQVLLRKHKATHPSLDELDFLIMEM